MSLFLDYTILTTGVFTSTYTVRTSHSVGTYLLLSLSTVLRRESEREAEMSNCVSYQFVVSGGQYVPTSKVQYLHTYSY